jgi:hypothetical protein
VSTLEVFPKFPLIDKLKIKIINNFKIFLMMCVRCVMKDASTFRAYITYVVTLIKLVKLIKLVFDSRLVSSAAMHLVRIFIYSK